MLRFQFLLPGTREQNKNTIFAIGGIMRSHAKSSIALFCLTSLLITSLAGCFSSTLDFQIRFDDVHGLKKGDPVVFEEAVIGTVAQVEYTDSGDFLASVALEKEFATAATEASKFYIDFHPQNRDLKAVLVVQMGTGGNPIEAGAVVQGRTKYAVLYEQFAQELGKNLSMVESGINEFFRALQGISDDEQLREIEKQLDEIIADLGNMTGEMKHKLEHEILPLLREKIEELRKSLEGSDQEDELESIDSKMDYIDGELSV